LLKKPPITPYYLLIPRQLGERFDASGDFIRPRFRSFHAREKALTLPNTPNSSEFKQTGYFDALYKMI
jgi:hypothetical protein